MASAALVYLLGLAYSRAGRIFGAITLMTWAAAGLAGLVAGTWALLGLTDARWPVLVASVIIEVEWCFNLLLYWSAANAVFSVRQAKRLFGLIGSGEVLAIIVVGLILPKLLLVTETRNLLLISAGADLLFLLLILSLSNRIRAAEAEETDEQASAEEGSSHGLLALLKHDYAHIPLVILGLLYFVYYIVDAAFYSQAQVALGSNRGLASFISRLMAAVSGATLVIRLFFTARWTRLTGIFGGLMTSPATVTAAAAVTLYALNSGSSMQIMFWLVVALKFIERTTWLAIGRVAVTTLYQPMPPTLRYHAQAAAETQVAPLAGGVAGALLLLLIKGLGLGVGGLCVLLLVVVTGKTAMALRARKRYPLQLALNLKHRVLSGEDLALDDPATRAFLEERLRNGTKEEVIYCMGLLHAGAHPRLAALLMETARHDEPSVRTAALEHLRGIASPDTFVGLCEILTSEEDPRVTGALLAAISSADAEQAVDVVRPYLGHQDVSVQSSALVCLLGGCGDPAEGEADLHLLGLERSADAGQRSRAARILGGLGAPRFGGRLVPLLTDKSLPVRTAALAAAGILKSSEAWPAVIGCLEQPELRKAAADALIAGGESVLGHVADSLADAPSPVQARLLQICGRIPSPISEKLLLDHLLKIERPTHQTVLTALRQKGFSTRTKKGRERFFDLLIEEVRRAALVMATQIDLEGLNEAVLLHRALDREFTRSQENIFTLVAIRYPSLDADQVLSSWRDGSSVMRAMALELVESTISRRDQALVMHLLEDIPAADQIDRLETKLQVECLGPEARLAQFGDPAGPWSGDPWIQGCAEEMINLPSQSKPDEAPSFTTLDKVRIMGKIDMLARVPDEYLAEAAQSLELLSFDEGEPIFVKGDAGSSMYIVSNGKVRVHDGRRTFAELGQGQVFGEFALLDPEPRSASVSASTGSTLFRFGRAGLLALMRDHTVVAWAILEQLCQLLRDRTVSAKTTIAPRKRPGMFQQGMSRVERVVLLGALEMFSRIPEPLLNELAGLCEETFLLAHEILLVQGEPNRSMYLVVSGRVKVHEGDNLLVELGKREILGELSAFSTEPVSATVTTLEDSRFLVISRSILAEVMDGQVEISHEIIRVIIQRIRRATS